MAAEFEPAPTTEHAKATARVKAYSDTHGGLKTFYIKDKDQFVVRMPADSDIPSGSVALSGLNLVAEASRFTAAQLEAVDDALLERKWTTNAEKYFYGFRYDATTDLVELATNAPAEIVRPLLQRFSGTLRVEYGEGGLENRYDDAANPHHGGAEIDTVFSLPCTSGFAYRWNNENFMVSAGHCFPPDYYVITGQIHNYGYVRGRAPYPTYDMSGIGKYPGCTQNCDTYVGSIYTEDNLVRGVGVAVASAENRADMVDRAGHGPTRRR